MEGRGLREGLEGLGAFQADLVFSPRELKSIELPFLDLSPGQGAGGDRPDTAEALKWAWGPCVLGACDALRRLTAPAWPGSSQPLVQGRPSDGEGQLQQASCTPEAAPSLYRWGSGDPATLGNIPRSVGGGQGRVQVSQMGGGRCLSRQTHVWNPGPRGPGPPRWQDLPPQLWQPSAQGFCLCSGTVPALPRRVRRCGRPSRVMSPRL